MASGTPRSRPPRCRDPLSPGRIVDASLRLVEDEGLAGFSTRKLGERLGVEAMSIYHHFPSKQHLLDALVAHAIATVEVPEPGPDAPARLRHALQSYRAMARRWPALFPLVAVHRLNMPAGVTFIERILRLVRSATPDDESAARQFRAIGYYLTGACLDETSGYARGPSAAEPVSDEFIVANCPQLVRAAPYFGAAHWDRTFQLGVDALLAGLQTTGPQPPAVKRSRKSAPAAARKPHRR
jgi:AcrR family transcriptional regulator